MESTQAIITKFLPNSGRIRATTASGYTVTVAHDYSLSLVESHSRAVQALIIKQHLKWGTQWVVGSTPDNWGYVFTPVSEYNTAKFLEG